MSLVSTLNTHARPRALFASWQPGQPHLREDLAPLARQGMRGLRLAGRLDLGPHDAAGATDHLALLRDAAGVGLRVSWRGAVGGVDPALLGHLDPPRGADGAAAWPVPSGLMLTARHGPGFVMVEDRRGGEVRRLLLDTADDVRMMAEPRYARFTADSPAASENALPALAGHGLFAQLGDWWVRLPVRYRRVDG